MKLRRNIGSAKPQLETYNIITNPEYQLAENIAAEFTDISGIKCIWHQKDLSITSDYLYGETQDIEYLEGKPTKILYEVGEIPTIYSMFGMVATDQIVAHIPQSVYRRDVSTTRPPTVGDVIIVPHYRDLPFMTTLSGRTFEIIHTAEDQAIFQLRSLVYSLYMIPYRFSEESESARNVSMDVDDLYDPTNAFQRFPETDTPSITAFGDNSEIQTDSDALSAYDGVDTSIYGYGG